MTTIRDVTDFLEGIAPLQYQEPYDNAGLIVGSHHSEVRAALISLDTTEAVIDEAIELGCNLVVGHHPIIFTGLKKINGYHYVEKAVIKAIKNDIAIYAIHTNLDNVLQDGVNSQIADKLGLRETRILRPKEINTIGSGLVGKLPAAMPFKDFEQYLMDHLELSGFRRTCVVRDVVEQVALCGGSGRFLLGDAIGAGAEVFISADFKYHEYFDANGEITIIDVGHYESEKFTIQLVHRLITGKFSKFAAYCTKVNTNPITYNYKNGHN
ncbi:MAG: Nif3-like dinuclear metal center hexameric protein [Saprospiraceae bacterium]|nr:Nif3-like dinuclear metal center hexameric protein [Saprospiraceae bacterium]